MHRGVRGLIGGGVSLQVLCWATIEGERRRRNAEENNQYN